MDEGHHQVVCSCRVALKAFELPKLVKTYAEDEKTKKKAPSLVRVGARGAVGGGWISESTEEQIGILLLTGLKHSPKNLECLRRGVKLTPIMS